ncbi:MAG: cell division control protein Cdc6, partial [Desulfurococcaceae archaeon]
MSAWDIIREELEKKSVFRGKESLTPEFLPEKLPHREEQLRELVAMFKHLAISPGSFSQKVLLVGSVGTGKTVTARIFGRDFTRALFKQGLSVKYVHINCHRNRQLYNIVLDIARQMNVLLPNRGLSAWEMYLAILNHLDETNSYAI